MEEAVHLMRIIEYGGTVGKDGTVTAATPGSVADPTKDCHATIEITTDRNTRSTFHSHPSGNVVNAPPAGTIGGSTTTYGFTQGPSSIDVNNVGNRTGYVFARGNGTVYIYNKTGVVASMPDKSLRK